MSYVNIQEPEIVCQFGQGGVSNTASAKIPTVTTRVYKNGFKIGSFVWSGRPEEMPLSRDKAGIPLILKKDYELEHDLGMRELRTVTGESIFKEIKEVLETYILLPSKSLYTLLALWIMHTWVFDLFPNTPYIHLGSPMPGCGKTITLEILNGLVSNGSGVAGRISEAGLRRAIQNLCSLILDEAERLSPDYKQFSDDLISAINSGHSKGAVALLTEMKKGKATDAVKSWNVYCPKAFASLGPVIDTISSRSFRFLLHKKRASDGLAEFILEDNVSRLEALRTKQKQWAKAFSAQGVHKKYMPKQQKGWTAFPGCSDPRLGRMSLPLLAIAKSIVDETGYVEVYSDLLKALQAYARSRDKDSQLQDVVVYAEAYKSLLAGRTEAVIANDDVEKVIKAIDKKAFFSPAVARSQGLDEVRPRTNAGRLRSFKVTQDWVDRVLSS